MAFWLVCFCFAACLMSAKHGQIRSLNKAREGGETKRNKKEKETKISEKKRRKTKETKKTFLQFSSPGNSSSFPPPL